MTYLLVDLPTCLSCAVLGDWLSLHDIPKLDLAYCSHEKRADYLSVVRSKELVFNNGAPSNRIYLNPCKCASFWRWVLKRDVKVLCIISGWVDVSATQFKKFLRWNGKYVRHVYATGSVSPQLLCCSKLLSFYFDVGSAADASPLLRRNPNLQELRIEGLGSHASIFSGINLQYLNQLSVCFCENHSHCLTALLAMCPRLQKLDIRGANCALDDATFFCPHLRSLSLELIANPYTLEGIIHRNINVASFVSRCPHVVNLKLVVGGAVLDFQILAVVQILRLRTLCLQFHRDCPLTDNSLEHIAEHCGTTLESFHLDLKLLDSDVCNYSHGALSLMRSRCANLRTFRCVASNVGYDTPSQSVTVLVGRSSISYSMNYDCSAVEILDLERSTYNEKEVRTMCKKCPKLHTIVVGGSCTTYEEMTKVVEKFQHLRLCKSSFYEYDIMWVPV